MSTRAIIDQMYDEMSAKLKAAKDARAAGNMDGVLAKLDACDALAEKIAEARRTADSKPCCCYVNAAALAKRVLHALDHSEDDARMHVELIEMCEGVIEADAMLGTRTGKLSQVYLRWHLDMADGRTLESNGLPYFAKVSGAAVSLVAADLMYLENERRALTANGRTGNMHLRMMALPDTGAGYVTVNLVEELEAGEDNPTKRAAEAAMDLVSLISRMPDAEAVKVVNVLKAGMEVLVHAQAVKKEVARD